MYVWLYMYTSINIYIHIYIQTYVHMYTYICIYIHMYEYIYIYICTYIHIWIHMFIYTRKLSPKSWPPRCLILSFSLSLLHSLSSSLFLKIYTHVCIWKYIVCGCVQCNTRQHTSTHCNALQHTATHCVQWDDTRARAVWQQAVLAWNT